MLRVTSEGSRLDSVSGRVSEEVDETEVITSGDQLAVLGHVDTVDVVTGGLLGEDSID